MSGRPPVNLPARGLPPMMELTLLERAVLARLRQAGPAGIVIGADLVVSSAIRLGLARLVWIDEAAQRVRLRTFDQ